MNTFQDFGLREELLRAVSDLAFVEPTPIQKKAIPQLLSKAQDIIALAQTGTGKTAAFGLPAIHNTDLSSPATQTLILCPTRELCVQISKDLSQYAKYLKDLHIVAVYGGSRIEAQIKALRRGAQIVVGTPGRVKDLIQRKKLKLDKIERVILDEADEMLSMGFKEELDAILSQTPDEKQTILFSATMHKRMIPITKKYLHNAIQLSVDKINTGATNVQHHYYMVNARDRYELLKRIADIHPKIYAIVFCRTRRDTKEIANKLMSDGYNADAIHGDLSQAQRDEVMHRFRKRHLQILVATDVAARGLDVQDLTHVINFNLPDDDESYTHRSGRTGRAGKTGISIAIIHSREQRRIREIEKRSGIQFTKMDAPTGKDICEKQLFTLIDKIERVHVDEAQIAPYLDAIQKKLDWLSREELIKHFVSAEFNRFLAYYKNAKDINIQAKPSRENQRDRSNVKQRRSTPFSRFHINIGTKNKLTPTRLIGLINECLDSSDAVIGKIELLRNFSFFEVDEQFESEILSAFKGKKFGGVPLVIELSQALKTDAFNHFRKEKKGKRKKYQRRDSRKKNARNARRRKSR